MTIRASTATLALALNLAAPVAYGDGGVTFTDIAADGEAGFEYRRGPSERDQVYDDLAGSPPVTFEEFFLLPTITRGLPGVALFDFDGDQDLDIYVTNGPGQNNALFANQLRESGQLTFIDVAEEAGVTAWAQDSHGVAFGDLDNDGDQDLLVLGGGEPNLLFENNGRGPGGKVTFTDITNQAGVGGGFLTHNSASMGDVNGDGLLDIVVANSFDLQQILPIWAEPFDLNQHNQLYLNTGNNVFLDVSETSGLRDNQGLVPASAAGSPGISWAIAMVDFDLDGDLDIMVADDQGAMPPAVAGGFNRGVLHLFQNDGSGQFTDINSAIGIDVTGSWMGLTYGDFNSDGHLDFFGSNFGDAATSIARMAPVLGVQQTRWFLGQEDGTFSDPGVGDLVALPFGWGCAARDFDNDGDTDILFHGGLNIGLITELTNPGALLLNDGQANFTFDAEAFADSTNHLLRTVHGVAVGDLDENGFVDIVSVSSFDTPPEAPIPSPFPLGSPFDPFASFVPTFFPTGDGTFLFNEAIQGFPDGTLSVEISSGDNGNGAVTISTLGTVGMTYGGVTNRDGIGAVVHFTPAGGAPVMQPIVGGSSHLSQHALAAHFGLGSAPKGTVDVLWPGGVRNRLYGARDGERLTFPEIPCSIDSDRPFWSYLHCVISSLRDLRAQGVIDRRLKNRLLGSALVAYFEER